MIKESKKHLNSVNESYFEHMSIATNVGFKMLLGGLMALIHGIVPAYFKLMLVIKSKNFMNSLTKTDKIIITII